MNSDYLILEELVIFLSVYNIKNRLLLLTLYLKSRKK